MLFATLGKFHANPFGSELQVKQMLARRCANGIDFLLCLYKNISNRSPVFISSGLLQKNRVRPSGSSSLYVTRNFPFLAVLFHHQDWSKPPFYFYHSLLAFFATRQELHMGYQDCSEAFFRPTSPESSIARSLNSLSYLFIVIPRHMYFQTFWY